MKHLLSAAAALCALIAAPAAAQQKPLETTSLPEIFAAYQAICVAHTGDSKAQAKAAQAAPYAMTPDGSSPDGTFKFINAKMFANVLDDGQKRYCMVTGRVADNTTLAQGVTLADPVLSKLGSAWPMEGKGHAWTKLDGTKVTAYLHMQHDVPGQRVASYMLGVEDMK